MFENARHSLATFIIGLTSVGATGAILLGQQGAAPSVAMKPPMLLGLVGEIAVSRTQIAFSYMGDLWAIERGGGVASRLTNTPGEEEVFPTFSPNGQRLAFARGAADPDIYLMSANGGEPQRLTYFPKADIPVGWSSDSREILFTSGRDGDNVWRLYTIPAVGVFESPLTLPTGVQGSFSPDGKRLAYLPKSYPLYAFGTWRYYRGGMASPLWIVNLGTLDVERVTSDASNARFPMWVGNRVYFVSDQTGTFNLYEYDTSSKRTRRLTTFESFGIDGAAAAEDAIAFVRSGRIYIYDLRAGTHREVSFSLSIDTPEWMPRKVAASRWVESVEYASDRVVVGARGDVHLLDVRNGTNESVTKTPGVAERYPTLAPDGQKLAFFADESGEYELHVRRLASGAVARIEVETHPSFYRELVWAPDSRRLAFSDIRLGLWVADTDVGSARRIDTSRYIAQGEYRPNWSPDGRYLTYAKARSDGMRTAFIYDTATERVHQLTDGLTHVEWPVFDQNGRHLYFISSTNARQAAASDIGWGLLSTELARPLVRRTLHAVVLRAGDTAAVAPSGSFGESPRADDASTAIDFDGIDRRIVQVPAGVRDYAGLRPSTSGQLFVRVTEWPATPGGGAPVNALYRLDLANPTRLQKIADRTDDAWSVSRDRTRVVYANGGDHFTGNGEGPPSRLELQRIQLQLEPAREWQQMYREAWRQMRDTFYDPDHHGQDLQALAREYEQLLPSITRRTYLNRLFLRMLGHVSISHLQVGGGDVPPAAPATAPVGDIGADFVLEGGRYRFVRIIRSPHFSVATGLLSGPMDQPGMDVREGDFLMSVDGQQVDGSRNVWASFTGKVNQPVTVTIATNASGEAARTYTVVPNAGTGALRNQARGERNLRRVEALSGGKVGYVYVGGYNPIGIDNVTRGLVGMRDRQALIIDQRNNGGGTTADALIEALNRQALYEYAYRYGDGFQVPPNVFGGPKVLITDETNFSAAETFALMFKLSRAGTIVGQRTGGGGIGAALFQPTLVDGGRIGIPNRAAYNPAGTWDIENTGIAPDVGVESLPRDWRNDRDPQLERAVQVALEGVKKEKQQLPRRPAYPVHK